MHIHTMRVLALSATVAAFALSSASAQEYSDAPRAYGPDEDVIVIAPRRRGPQTYDYPGGAQTETVGISEPVRFDDLDLSTPWGARELHDRIVYKAHALCARLDRMYPVDGPYEPADRFGSTDCYRDAVADGMEQADQAIAQARAYGD